MKAVIVLGSRIYQPMSDVDERVRALPAGTLVLPFGSSDVALCAESTAKDVGLQVVRKPLESTRRQLLDECRKGADVLMFVARDPETKQPTTGMADLQRLLKIEGIAYELVSSPFPGRICELITDLGQSVTKTLAVADTDRRQHRRRITLAERALKLATTIAAERDRYQRRLEETANDGVGDDDLDAKYIRWVRVYEALCDALDDATRILMPAKAA